MSSLEVSMFIPVYNEGARLEKNIVRAYDELSKICKRFELIIVDDNSRDGTASVARKLAEKYKNLRYVRYRNGPSRRENLAKSFYKARYPNVAFMDADLATDISYLGQLLTYVDSGYDVATGSRYKGLKPRRKLFRLCISGLYNRFMRLYFGSNIHDHQCGFKAFRKAALLDIVDKMGYDRSLRRGWFWDAEALIRAQKQKLKIKEFQVEWHFGNKSTFNILRELRMISYVLMLRHRL